MTIIRRRSRGSPRHESIKIRISFAPLPPEDVTTVHGLRVTTITRTLIDLAGDLDRGEAVRITRQALDRDLVSLDELRRAAETRTDLDSIEAFRDVLRIVDPAS